MLNDFLNIRNTRTVLVCSNLSKSQTLQQNTPDKIAEFTEVVFFPAAETLNQLIFLHKPFKDALKRICFSSESDKLEALAIILLGHWDNYKTTVFSGKQLLSSLQTIFPNYLAKMTTVTELMPDVKNIFSAIAHFKYTIEKGYFSWEYAGLDSGILPYPVDSNDFVKFQRQVIAKHPRQFSELEGILL